MNQPKSLRVVGWRELVDLPDLCLGGIPSKIDSGARTSSLHGKLLEGTQGIGVVLAETLKGGVSIIKAFRGANIAIMVQEFIKEAGGADIRCLVLGGKVVAAMKRQGAEGEFCSNFHRGGSAQLVKITPEERSTAVRAAKAMRLNVCGVDLLRSNHGPVIMEVNS